MQLSRLAPAISARLATIRTDESILAAALHLSRPDVGLIIVCDDSGKALGVLGRSDLLRHMASTEAAKTAAANLMVREIVSATLDDDLRSTWRMMAARQLQRLPVLTPDSRPVGILDIRDAMKALLEQEELQEQELTGYIAGEYSI